MHKRKHDVISSFDKEFLQLCKKHHMVTASLDEYHVIQTEKRTARSCYWTMNLKCRNSSIRLRIDNSFVFETHLPPHLNEAVLRYVDKPTAYIFLSSLVGAGAERKMWASDRFWLRLCTEKYHLAREFFKYAPIPDLLLLKKDALNETLIQETLGFRGDLDVLTAKLPLRKFEKDLILKVLQGFFYRRDQNGMQKFLQNMLKVNRFCSSRSYFQRYILVKFIEHIEKEDFAVVDSFLTLLMKLVPPPLSRTVRQKIEDIFFDKDPQIVQRVRELLQ